jgi:hypothetical protein
MGLDQFAFIETNPNNRENDTEIAYWRKHNRLHGWMENLWITKGGLTTKEDAQTWGSSFNGQKLTPTLKDIINLEKDVLAYTLPKTTGFFFGLDSYLEDCPLNHYYHFDSDMDFIKKAKELIQEGKTIYYVCSW